MLFIQQMGKFGILLIILSVVIVALAVKKSIDLFMRRDLDLHQLEKGLHGILFWGVIASVLGVLGQISGIYNALHAIIRATEIDPRIVFMGFAESFTTTLYGLTTLLISAVIWFTLYTRYKKLEGKMSG
jgi:biopolymer transport protein ExbB/TolQ